MTVLISAGRAGKEFPLMTTTATQLEASGQAVRVS